MQLSFAAAQEHNMIRLLTKSFVGAFTGMALLALPAIGAPAAPQGVLAGRANTDQVVQVRAVRGGYRGGAAVRRGGVAYRGGAVVRRGQSWAPARATTAAATATTAAAPAIRTTRIAAAAIIPGAFIVARPSLEVARSTGAARPTGAARHIEERMLRIEGELALLVLAADVAADGPFAAPL
jgi:hypothetical protein